MDTPLIVQTTVETKQNGQDIADIILQKRLAACVQISGPVESRYWWKEKIERSDEYIVSMKTFGSVFHTLEQALIEAHPYDVPEIVSFELKRVSADYLEWMESEIEK